MVTISHNQVWRGDTAIGSVGGSRCYDLNNNEIGWYEGDRIYHADRGEIGYVEGDYVHYSDTTRFGLLNDLYETVGHSDSYYSPMLCAAVAMIFGKE